MKIDEKPVSAFFTHIGLTKNDIGYIVEILDDKVEELEGEGKWYTDEYIKRGVEIELSLVKSMREKLLEILGEE